MIRWRRRPNDLSATKNSQHEGIRSGFFAIDPLRDPRWGPFLAAHPQSSAYHSAKWLLALQQTYGYTPIAFTTSPPREALQNAIVFCDVETWLTRRRLVSLPFSDHCAILFDDHEDLNAILSKLEAKSLRKQLEYVEIRPTEALNGTASYAMDGYCGHRLDLDPDLDTLFRSFHRSSTQRKIRRAEREGLEYQVGRSPYLLNCFYDLLVITRRRHGTPPQPKRWFQSLVDSFGNDLDISLALQGDRPIAAILTLRYKDTLLFKYGSSDNRFHNLGGVHLLFWKSIVGAKENGLRTFDLGRSAWSNGGLITFKDRWGACRTSLNYFRFPSSKQAVDFNLLANSNWKERVAKAVFSRLPAPILRIAGEIIYRHIG